MQEQYEKTNAIIGRLGNRIGDFVEGLVRPGLMRLFNERGHPAWANRAVPSSPGAGEETMEVDLVGINGDEVVVVEVKSKLTVMMCGITSTRWRTSNASFSATPTTASSVR